MNGFEEVRRRVLTERHEGWRFERKARRRFSKKEILAFIAKKGLKLRTVHRKFPGMVSFVVEGDKSTAKATARAFGAKLGSGDTKFSVWLINVPEESVQESMDEGKKPTFLKAREALIVELKKRGWAYTYWGAQGKLKVPYATSKDGRLRLWFKSQAVLYTQTNGSSWDKHTFKDARSLHIDIRAMTPEEVVAHLSKHYEGVETDAESVEESITDAEGTEAVATGRKTKLYRKGEVVSVLDDTGYHDAKVQVLSTMIYRDVDYDRYYLLVKSGGERQFERASKAGKMREAPRQRAEGAENDIGGWYSVKGGTGEMMYVVVLGKGGGGPDTFKVVYAGKRERAYVQELSVRDMHDFKKVSERDVPREALTKIKSYWAYKKYRKESMDETTMNCFEAWRKKGVKFVTTTDGPREIAGTIERFSSTINKRLVRARDAARDNKLDTAWRELDGASASLRSLLKMLDIARHGG